MSHHVLSKVKSLVFDFCQVNLQESVEVHVCANMFCREQITCSLYARLESQTLFWHRDVVELGIWVFSAQLQQSGEKQQSYILSEYAHYDPTYI